MKTEDDFMIAEIKDALQSGLDAHVLITGSQTWYGVTRIDTFEGDVESRFVNFLLPTGFHLLVPKERLIAVQYGEASR